MVQYQDEHLCTKLHQNSRQILQVQATCHLNILILLQQETCKNHSRPNITMPPHTMNDSGPGITGYIELQFFVPIIAFIS